MSSHPCKNNEQAKRKKSPACDYCKARRVICHAQPNGPCPRCKEKGVPCTTTAPAPRRRRRTRAEMQEERAMKKVKGILSPDESEAQILQVNDIRTTTRELYNSVQFSPAYSHCVTTPLGSPNPVSPSFNLPPNLIAELFQTFRILPQSLHPVISLDEVESSLRLASWNLASLPSQLRLLAHIIITLASFFSTNAVIIGPGGYGPEIACIALSQGPLKEAAVPDLREYGVRRKPVCYQLWAEALWLAHQEGITAHVSRENAVSCWLLDFLECRFSGQGVSTYAHAYNGHLRCLAETNIGALPGCSADCPETAVLYRAYMMHDAVYAVTNRRSIPFSHSDELLIVGQCTTSLEQLLQTFVSGASNKEIFLSMNAFTSNTIRVARESSERLTGVYARRQPLDETFVGGHFISLDLLHSILLAERGRALRAAQSSTESHFLRSCVYALYITWGCLVLNFHELLLDRLKDSSLVDSVATTDCDAQERLGTYFTRVRHLALGAAVEISEALTDVPCISRITHLHCGEIEKWAKFLLEESKTMAKGVGPNRLLRALECYRNALKIVGFSWVDHSGLVESIDRHIASEMPDDASNVDCMTENDYTWNLFPSMQFVEI
ncbi:hypothetical protein GGU10DRAFT_391341 [Lentinula aff. detonsa]|uniref:Zn(2)-C6 fungal-type domain-containing protein n=1 Tax=Lentinula aff. detonsa TaxID=2804958 RepID=A0AA38NB58_9AGAR|nr:hypothetical protein GGU10DRAFT_391341 [Lentinula aff. detonsa]